MKEYKLAEKANTYEDWNVCVNSCFNSPLWFIVNIRIVGIPTARYAQTSWKKKRNKQNTRYILCNNSVEYFWKLL